MAVAKIADNFDRATNPHPNPTNFEHEICIRRMRILAGSVTSILVMALSHGGNTINITITIIIIIIIIIIIFSFASLPLLY